MQTSEITIRRVIQIDTLPIPGDQSLLAYQLVVSSYQSGASIKEDLEIREGICTQNEVKLCLNGTMDWKNSSKLRDGQHSSLVCVKPAFVEMLRMVGWGGDSGTGVYDQNLYLNEPYSALKSNTPCCFIELFSYAHEAYALDGTSLPICKHFSYIDGGYHNGSYDLKVALKILQARDDVTLIQSRWDGYIQNIPSYNRDAERDQYIEFTWHPKQEDWDKVHNYMKATPDKYFAMTNAMRDLDILGLNPARKA